MTNPTSSPSVSIVIPVYNGMDSIGALVAKLEEHLSREVPLKVILVNDASPADSLNACLEAQRKANIPVTVVDLSRNFGEHNAVMAGLHHVKTDYVVIMDDDFQNPPGEVHKLIAKARIQVALSHRHTHGCGDPLAERTGGRLNAFGDEIFRMARGWPPKLAEGANVIAANTFVSCEMQQRVDQH